MSGCRKHLANNWKVKVKVKVKVKSCLTLCDTLDCSLLGSSVHGIFQATVLAWIAISFSREITIGNSHLFIFTMLWIHSLLYLLSLLTHSWINFWQKWKYNVLLSKLMNELNPNVKQFIFHFAYSVVLELLRWIRVCNLLVKPKQNQQISFHAASLSWWYWWWLT